MGASRMSFIVKESLSFMKPPIPSPSHTQSESGNRSHKSSKPKGERMKIYPAKIVTEMSDERRAAIHEMMDQLSEALAECGAGSIGYPRFDEIDEFDESDDQCQ